jgi:hypothetical protein
MFRCKLKISFSSDKAQVNNKARKFHKDRAITLAYVGARSSDIAGAGVGFSHLMNPLASFDDEQQVSVPDT